MRTLAPLALGQVLSLTNGEATVDLVPSCGARLLKFDIGDRAILRRSGNRTLERLAPYDFSAFPLLPYSGPIFGGGFFFADQFYRLDRNVAAEADATHGDAWINDWRIEEARDSHVRLALDFTPATGGFPFAWSGDLTYTLAPSSLTVDIAIRNRDHRAMPAGFGFHPYFPRVDATRLTFGHGDVWPPDSPSAVRVGPMPIDGLDFNGGQDLTGLVADRCFEQWPGIAHLDYPDGARTTITATPEFGKMQIYVPWYDPYLCVEPVSNANDGFNRAHASVAGHGVVVLEPGQSLAGSIRIAAGSWNV